MSSAPLEAELTPARLKRRAGTPRRGTPATIPRSSTTCSPGTWRASTGRSSRRWSGVLEERDAFSRAAGLRVLDLAIRMPGRGWAVPRALSQFAEVIRLAVAFGGHQPRLRRALLRVHHRRPEARGARARAAAGGLARQTPSSRRRRARSRRGTRRSSPTTPTWCSTRSRRCSCLAPSRSAGWTRRTSPRCWRASTRRPRGASRGGIRRITCCG